MRRESRNALTHVLESAREIRAAVAGKSMADYAADRFLRAVVERFFITIGEALSRILRHDPDLFGAIPEARSVVGFRNVLVHGYDVVDEEQVWAAITDDLERLVGTVEALLED